MSEPPPPAPTHPSCITAPDLVGAEGSVASAQVRAHGLLAVCHELEVAPNRRSGQVLAQIPTAGSALSADEPIALLIATTSTGGSSVREPLAADIHGFGDWPEPASEATPERLSASTSPTTGEGERAARSGGPQAYASSPRGEPVVRPRATWERSRRRAAIGLAALPVVMAFGIALNPMSPSRGEQRGAAITSGQPDADEPSVPRPSLSRRKPIPLDPKLERAERPASADGSHRRTAPSRRARRAPDAARTTQAQESTHHSGRAASRPTQGRPQTPASPSPLVARPPASAGATSRAPSPAPVPPGPEFF